MSQLSGIGAAVYLLLFVARHLFNRQTLDEQQKTSHNIFLHWVVVVWEIIILCCWGLMTHTPLSGRFVFISYRPSDAPNETTNA
jgi:heme/copper-type cytochrome/quinol oxidase subunit 2